MVAASAAAAAAAAKFSGRFAVHPLLPGVAQLAATSCIGKVKPSWTPQAQELLGTWEKLAPCMTHYSDFRKKTKAKDIKKLHVFMNDAASAELAKFYLCCALRLRPDAVEEAGQDSDKLLQLASAVAQEDVEPFFEECRRFVDTYDEDMHRKLDETTVWHEVNESLFWHASFEAAAPTEYASLQAAALPPQDSWPASEDEAILTKTLEASAALVEDSNHAASEAARVVFSRFLEASSCSVKGAIRTALIDHGIIVDEVKYRREENPPQKPLRTGPGGPREAKIE